MTTSSRSWWWRGAALKREDEQQVAAAAGPPPFRSVALVVGSTSLVGTSLVDMLPLPGTPGGPWKVYALSRRPPPPWSPPPPASVTHFHVDLSDSGAAQNREVNSAMLRNVLAVVVPSCPALAHVSLQTGTKHYMGPPEAFGRTAALDLPYTEDMPRLDWPNFYYNQEDLLFDALARRGGGEGAAVSWSVHRPNLILGLSPRSAMNIVCSLCVYAAICRKEGVPLRWPGSLGTWEGFSSASDADLVAEQQIWAAVDPMAKNEAFNCSNGDVYRWRQQLWPILAGRFGLEWVGYEGEEKRVKVSDAMAGKEAVWAEIVEEKQLVPTQLHEVANWWFVDALFSVKLEFLDSMNKSKEHGFFGFRKTGTPMKAYNIVH
ncbi:hypothetical protein PVAP13_8KG111603 [Panicum virgatum]|uniref:PRISE-like Rossmann-fold domain-containing protein n=1 Tax=Panicum virgatum TaxID=38727 RepID=A0A8T0PKK9_PANVG|nr:hypothetical protein PVAP13_8KG111603 [Panicum virgatum]